MNQALREMPAVHELSCRIRMRMNRWDSVEALHWFVETCQALMVSSKDGDDESPVMSLPPLWPVHWLSARILCHHYLRHSLTHQGIYHRHKA